jgi:hypothetical protein
MHTSEPLIFNFGPRTLSRVYCEICKEETLHVRGVCNHCPPQPSDSEVAVRREIRGRVPKAESAVREDRDAMCQDPDARSAQRRLTTQ